METYGSPSQFSSAIPGSELRIILIGSRGAGKSSALNTILGRDEFFIGPTPQSLKEQGKIEGRNVTLVDTPGWWLNSHAIDTPQMRRYEILHSASLMPPGPCVFLLVMPVDFIITETTKRATEEHLGLLGDGVWSHTLVLFTCGDKLGNRSFKEHLEREGKSLQYLIDKCENRYHVLNNKERGNLTQIKELLWKIEEMVAETSDPCYDIGNQRSHDLIRRNKQIEEKAKERRMNVEKQKEKLRSIMGDAYSSELRIVLLGFKGAGMSSSGNGILAKEAFTLARTTECAAGEGAVAGKLITVVDTPGWWRGHLLANSQAQDIRAIFLSTSLCPPGPHVFLLAVRADLAFTEMDRRSVVEHLELLGERVWSHTLVLFTNGDSLGEATVEKHIESEGEPLQWLVEKCGNRFHALKQDAGVLAKGNIQITELLMKIEEIIVANNGHYFEADRRMLQETEAKIKADLKCSGNMIGSLYQSITLSRSMEKPPRMCGDAVSISSLAYSSQWSLASTASQESRISNMSSGFESMCSINKPLRSWKWGRLRMEKRFKSRVTQKRWKAKSQ